MRENMEVENVVNHEIEIVHNTVDVKSPQTTIPFVKNNNFFGKGDCDRTISRELSIIKSLDYLPKEIKACFQQAADKIRNELTWGHIQDIKRIVGSN